LDSRVAAGYSGDVDIREVMTVVVVTAPPDASLRDVAELMRDRNVGSVVLADPHERPVGFITDRDLAITVVADAGDAQGAAAAHASAPVVTATVGMGVEEAAELMVRHGIRRLPVLDGERLAGIVTLDDLAVRTGDIELARHMTGQITRAALPDFFFHDRGG
jgi:CBS domain-containing protein